jgi:hypothetical protein
VTSGARMTGIDPRNAARHRRAVAERSRSNVSGFVMPADWRERRALRRMTDRGEAVPALGLPNVWIVFYSGLRRD